ncbi:MAG: PepSY domain-containing protein [Sphingomicrobium sp.]
MRRYHRWIATVFGVFLLWISATGVLSQIGQFVNDAAKANVPAAAAPAGFICPETMTCRPRPAPGAWNLGALHHLHSGEYFGRWAQIVSLLSGCALFFFAVSGLWMYLELYRGRMVRVRSAAAPTGGRFFWK